MQTNLRLNILSWIEFWILKRELMPNVKKYSQGRMLKIHIKMMNTCSFVILLVAFRFQTVCGNSNAAFDKHYSDKLIKNNNNQQSSPEQNNDAYHVTTLFSSNRLQTLTTDPSIDLKAPHETLHVNTRK